MRTEEPISLTFSPDEALVLFEFVVRSDNAESLPVIDHAEQMVLWRLEAQLEKSLVEPFDPRYLELLDEARRRVRADERAG